MSMLWLRSRLAPRLSLFISPILPLSTCFDHHNMKNRPSEITSPTSVSRQILAYHHNSTLEPGTSPPCHWLCACATKHFPARGQKVKPLDFMEAPRTSGLSRKKWTGRKVDRGSNYGNKKWAARSTFGRHN